jgi:hypothetical protein
MAMDACSTSVKYHSSRVQWRNAKLVAHGLQKEIQPASMCKMLNEHALSVSYIKAAQIGY